MLVHKSALKRIRSDAKKRLRNKYKLKTCRTYIKKLRSLSDMKEMDDLFNKVASMLDKLAKKNIIHFNKSSNLKSKLAKFINSKKAV